MSHESSAVLHRCLREGATALGCCMMASAASGALPLTMPAQGPSASGSISSSTGGSTICLDEIFYRALPGKANYCQGMRDWKKGHYRSGLELLKLAAGWGNKNAQYTLGLIYYNGHHVSADPSLGIAWLTLANERHNDAQIALATRSAIDLATDSQRRRARQLLKKMRLKYGDKVAATRAWKHLQHWKSSRGFGPLAQGCVFIHGRQAHAVVEHGLGTVRWINVSHKKNHPRYRLLVCVTLQTQEHLVRQIATHYFKGLFGTVTVGPLRSVPAPTASSVH